jgi:hypothetical protein
MLELLADCATPRQLRLFAVACCRRAWDHLDPESHQAVNLAECYADGAASDVEVEAMATKLHFGASCYMTAACHAINSSFDHGYSDEGKATVIPYGLYAATSCAAEARREYDNDAAVAGITAEAAVQCALVRDIFGNPFRAATLSPVGGTTAIVSLARAAYDERQLPSGELDPHRLAVLADALEEAGAPADLAEHLRGPGPHVRGCHVVDLCLGLS